MFVLLLLNNNYYYCYYCYQICKYIDWNDFFLKLKRHLQSNINTLSLDKKKYNLSDPLSEVGISYQANM